MKTPFEKVELILTLTELFRVRESDPKVLHIEVSSGDFHVLVWKSYINQHLFLLINDLYMHLDGVHFDFTRDSQYYPQSVFVPPSRQTEFERFFQSIAVVSNMRRESGLAIEGYLLLD